MSTFAVLNKCTVFIQDTKNTFQSYPGGFLKYISLISLRIKPEIERS